MIKLISGIVILFFLAIFGLLWWAICEVMGAF